MNNPYKIAVITNKHHEFIIWRNEYKKHYINTTEFEYFSIVTPDGIRGHTFDGIIVPKGINRNTNSFNEIMRYIDICFLSI